MRVTKSTSVGLAFYGFTSNVDRIFSTVDAYYCNLPIPNNSFTVVLEGVSEKASS